MLCSNILYILLANIYITLRQIESARNQLLLFSILSLFPSWRFYFFRHPPNDGFSRCELRDTVVHESSRNVANFLDLTLNTWILLSSSPLCFPLLSPFIPPVVRFKRFSRRHWRENLNFEKERKVISRLPFNLHRDHGTCGWVFFTDTYFRLTWRLLLPLFERRRQKILNRVNPFGQSSIDANFAFVLLFKNLFYPVSDRSINIIPKTCRLIRFKGIRWLVWFKIQWMDA